MGTLREELEKRGYKATEEPPKQKDQYPKIDVRDPEVMKDFERDIQSKTKALYRRQNKTFAFKRKSGNVREVKMKRVNPEAKWYQIMQSLFAQEKPVSIKEMTAITGLNESSVGTYLAKFAEFGVASKATIDGVKKYSRLESVDPVVAPQLFVDKIYQPRPKRVERKRISVVGESPGQVAEPETFQGLSPQVTEKIVSQVVEKIVQKIVVEVVGKIEILFKFGGMGGS